MTVDCQFDIYADIPMQALERVEPYSAALNTTNVQMFINIRNKSRSQ